MQEGGNTRVLERPGQRRPTAGDERHLRAGVEDRRQLTGAQLGGHETEDAHAPRAVAQQILGLLEQVPGGIGGHEGQGQEGQAAFPGHVGSERRAVAHSRHRALGDRVAQPEGVGEGGSGLEGTAGRSGAELRVDGGAHGVDHATCGVEPRGQARGESRVLTGGEQ